MLQVELSRLKKILTNNKILYFDNEVSNDLLDKEIKSIDGIAFNDYILDYANKNNLKLLSFSFEWDEAFKALNDNAIKEYTIYPRSIYLPLSDASLGVISSFIDEYDDGAKSTTFNERAYEVFKLISLDLGDDFIVIYDL